jgi:iron complex outermembrane receptor protein
MRDRKAEMKKRILAALCGCLFTGSRAETTNTVTNTVPDAERIIVTATRSASDVRTVPGNPSVITAQDIADGHYTSVPEALQKKAGLFFRNYADNPSQASVDIRGFGGDNPHGKVLVLLNGRKLNRPDMATINWAQIPMQAVERIEVVRGPNSVLYGDHAVSGVINIITKDASEKPETTIQASAGSCKAFDQNLVTSGSLDGLGYVATAGHQSGDGYRDRSAYDTSSGSLRLSGDINEQLSAYAEGSVVKEQHQLPGSLTLAQVQSDRRQAVNQNDAARETSLNAITGIELIPSESLILNIDGGFSRKELEADMASFGPINGFSDNLMDTYSLSPKMTVLTPVAGMNNRLIAGADYVRDNLKIDRYNEPSRSTRQGSADIVKETFEYYIHDSLSLLEDKLLLSTGARRGASRFNVNSDAQAYPPWFVPAVAYSDSKRHSEEAYHLGLTALPAETVKVYVKADKLYRYPFTDEQANYYGYGSDAFNSTLVPEKGDSLEAGVELTPVSNLVLQASVFRTDMKDEIAFVGWPVNANINLDETTHRGVELSADYRNDLFAATVLYTWLQSEFTAGVNKGNEIPWVPRNKLDVNLAFFLTDALTLNTHMSYVGSMFQSGDNANTGANRQSEYALFDLLLEYTLPVKKCEVTVFAGGDNLFETEYNYLVSYGGYYPAPERTYKAGLSVRF